MGKSANLRLADVRQTYRLLGECRELRGAGQEWAAHAFTGFTRLLGARGSNGGHVEWQRPAGIVRFLRPVVTGFTAAELAVFAQFMRSRDPSGDPIFGSLGRCRGALVTRTRQQLVSDADWYRSVSFNDYRRVVGVDQCVYSLYALPTSGTFSLMGLHRSIGDRPFSPREASLLHLFHEELGPLIGAPPADSTDLARLSPRLRETLYCLLEGDSEKQVANRLDVSVPTVHQYVMALYRKFGVNSRAELMARFICQPAALVALDCRDHMPERASTHGNLR
jgi:DNA-binding CsgD family transcriptional regulator